MKLIQLHEPENQPAPSGKEPQSRRTNSSRLSSSLRNSLKPPLVIVGHSLLTVAIYITMIEGLGKGVKYSLFVANAIIFVSSPREAGARISINLHN